MVDVGHLHSTQHDWACFIGWAPPGGGDPLVTGSSPTPAAAFLLAAAQAMPSDPERWW